MIRTGEAANAAEVSRMEGLTRARVSQILGLLRLAPAILHDLEDQEGTGPVPTAGAMRKLSMLPAARQTSQYRTLIEAEEQRGRPKKKANSSARRSREHLPRRGFSHLLEQARRYQALLDGSEVRSLEEIAQREGISASRVGQVLGLLQLAPDIVDLVDRPADQEKPITYRALLRIARMPDHADQRRTFYGRLASPAG